MKRVSELLYRQPLPTFAFLPEVLLWWIWKRTWERQLWDPPGPTHHVHMVMLYVVHKSQEIQRMHSPHTLVYHPKNAVPNLVSLQSAILLS